MTWQGLHGHDEVADRFRHSIQRGRLGSSFLFVGAPGIGKRTFALKFAQAVLCERTPPEEFDPCGECPACRQVAADTHPDIEQIAKPADRRTIPLELLIGDKQHRMREGLCARISLRPARGRRKVAIIDDADALSIEGANCLLKTLEEPPADSIIILVGTSEQRQLPTIRSRCQVVRFQSLEPKIAAELLVEQQIVSDPDEALRLATATGGSLTRAAQMVAPELWQFRAELRQTLDTSDWDSLDLAKQISSFLEEAGSGTPERRDRLERVVEMAIDFYRDLMIQINGDAHASTASSLAATWNVDPERPGRCIDLCIHTISQVRSNANVANVVDAWIDELARLALGEPYFEIER